ncbi:type II toxin-antitoxin system Phd/YefM family antitoxin [Chromatocurvus halotolerans]|uniref:Antitoxin n=1 Tax=Chromatocurvus halotolerans TaxID=1132028 RepID=A0A4R2KRW0_9GAMM|nr:type II toxin-antitoxin system Phd/YefM family antitoxin [Chromatocurvus halotolerans]TCO75517.1 prevent-host-death family protein [Chromatocurvus halotolerans]
MSLARQIKPISYLKSSTAEAVRTVTDTGEPLYITQNGEARIVVQDIHTYEKTQETLALLRILALGEAEVMKGDTVPADEAIEVIRQRLRS